VLVIKGNRSCSTRSAGLSCSAYLHFGRWSLGVACRRRVAVSNAGTLTGAPSGARRVQKAFVCRSGSPLGATEVAQAMTSLLSGLARLSRAASGRAGAGRRPDRGDLGDLGPR